MKWASYISLSDCAAWKASSCKMGSLIVACHCYTEDVIELLPRSKLNKWSGIQAAKKLCLTDCEVNQLLYEKHESHMLTPWLFSIAANRQFRTSTRHPSLEDPIMVEGSIFTPSDLEDEEEKEKRKKKSTFNNEFKEAEFRWVGSVQICVCPILVLMVYCLLLYLQHSGETASTIRMCDCRCKDMTVGLTDMCPSLHEWYPGCKCVTVITFKGP